MIINVSHTVNININDDEIDDMIRILHVAYQSFSGRNRIDKGHIKTPYVDSARVSARELIENIYSQLPCSWGKPAL